MFRSPRDFFKPKVVGAPEPIREIPILPSRMIHFFDPSNTKMATKVPEIAQEVDIILGNLEDAVPIDRKEIARKGLVTIGKNVNFGTTQFWTRVNSIDSPWFLDDLICLVGEIGNQLDVIMLPKVQGPWDIYFTDQLLAQLESKFKVKKPILLHAILETALGVANVENIANASPRMQGMSLGPADLAASRRMKTTRVGGGHPDYIVRSDSDQNNPGIPRKTAQQDLWHYTICKMVDACASVGALAFYGPFGDIADLVACEDQFRNAYLMGCVGAWTLHPNQINIAKKVFSPKPEEVSWAQKVIASMPDGSGAVMIDGKMQDDATWKQCQVILNLAQLIAERDPEYRTIYNLTRQS